MFLALNSSVDFIAAVEQGLNLSIWDKTNGTWINIGTVLSGTGIGLLLRNRLRTAFLSIITQAVGLITLFVGFTMAGSLLRVKAGSIDGVILGLIATLVGGLLGEWWQLEAQLKAAGDWLKRHLKGSGKFTEGFVTASLLFCVGPMAILGCLNNGLTGDNRILILKSTMDGFAAIALTSSLGVGVGCSGLVILLYQGGLSLSAGLLSQFLIDPATDPRILLLSGVGGLMIIGLGLNLLEIAQVQVASFLPALLFAPVIYAIALWVKL
jgi:uncharacterized membrane protein YqgA involved in biofilm formation